MINENLLNFDDRSLFSGFSQTLIRDSCIQAEYDFLTHQTKKSVVFKRIYFALV